MLQSDVIILGLPKMDGCSALTDLNLESCEKLTAEGLADFCAQPPPALQKLNLSYETLECKLLAVSCITHATQSDVIIVHLSFTQGDRRTIGAPDTESWRLQVARG